MDWFNLAAGQGCPFDQPREEPNPHWDSVARLSASTLCLLKNQHYRGHCILIYDARHATRLDELTTAEWLDYARDLQLATKVLVEFFQPDHINVESLGNEMPHLHWHLIPRYQDDPRWGGPIWMTTRDEMSSYELGEQDREERLRDLRSALSQAQAASTPAGS